MDAALYGSLGDGFGIAPESDLLELRKAMDVGYGTDAATLTGGNALRVQSLEHTLKTVTFTAKHAVIWRDLPKTKAFSTVEEYTRLSAYGTGEQAFLASGELPETQDATYARQVALTKFMGVTKEVTHPASLVQTHVGDLIARANLDGIAYILREVERSLITGDSKLGVAAALGGTGAEGVEFDGIDKQIAAANVIDLKGQPLDERAVRNAANIVLSSPNFGVGTHLYANPRTLEDLAKEYIPAARIPLATPEGTLAGGFVVDRIRTAAGEIRLMGDVFITNNGTLNPPTAATNAKAATPPAAGVTATVAGADDTTTDWAKTGTTVDSVQYRITFANAKGESAQTPADDSLTAAIGAANRRRAVTVAASMPNALTAGSTAPTFAKIYRRTTTGGVSTPYSLIARVAIVNTLGAAALSFADRNAVMSGTSVAYLGELTPEVIQVRQLLDLVRMDLAVVAPAYRWMLLLYLSGGILYAPGKWVRIVNVGES